MNTRLLGLDEAAEKLGVSMWTLRRWVWARKIPSVRLGRRVLLRHADLEALIVAGLRDADARVCLPGVEPPGGAP